jgi:hypothetical protein
MVKKFTWTFQNVYENTAVDIEDGATCADLFIYNNPKSNAVLINGSVALPAGQTLSLPAFGIERQEGTLLFDFGVTGKGWITIGRKRYK